MSQPDVSKYLELIGRGLDRSEEMVRDAHTFAPNFSVNGLLEVFIAARALQSLETGLRIKDSWQAQIISGNPMQVIGGINLLKNRMDFVMKNVGKMSCYDDFKMFRTEEIGGMREKITCGVTKELDGGESSLMWLINIKGDEAGLIDSIQQRTFNPWPCYSKRELADLVETYDMDGSELASLEADEYLHWCKANGVVPDVSIQQLINQSLCNDALAIHDAHLRTFMFSPMDGDYVSYTEDDFIQDHNRLLEKFMNTWVEYRMLPDPEHMDIQKYGIFSGSTFDTLNLVTHTRSDIALDMKEILCLAEQNFKDFKTPTNLNSEYMRDTFERMAAAEHRLALAMNPDLEKDGGEQWSL